jgi:predicted PurR-regulated permease PerM
VANVPEESAPRLPGAAALPHRATASKALLLASLLLLAFVLKPIWQPLLFAAVLAAVVWPAHDWLSARLGGRRNLAAGIVSLGVVALLLTPLTLIGIIAVRQAIEAIAWIRGALEEGGVHEIIRPLPDNVERFLRPVLDRLPLDLRALAARSTEAGRWAALQLQSALTTVSTFAFDLVMMLIALFFLLADGRRLVDWLRGVSPLGPARTQELLGEFRLVSRAVIGSNFLTGVAQATAATIGYYLARVPQPLFFGLLTLLASFIPSVGTAIVSLPLAALLLLLGHPIAALFLVGWSILIVGTLDNLLRPLLIRGDMNVHGALVFFVIIGGIGLLGLAGLVVGPLALGLFLALMRFYGRDIRRAAHAGS